TFVEWTQLDAGSGKIAKYHKFPKIPKNDKVAFEFCKHWFDGFANKDDLIQLVACDGHEDGSFGTACSEQNTSFVTTGNASVTLPDPGDVKRTNAIANSTNHEFGHQFVKNEGHVDKSLEGPPDKRIRDHAKKNYCIMTYDRDREDRKAVEFDKDHLYEIRDATLPR
ncbi:MAG: hypothetical protein ACREDF_03760, partial [Thermoplasmata archaeon]